VEEAAPRVRVTDGSPPLRRGVCEAFYALGTFVMLVQAEREVGKRREGKKRAALVQATHALLRSS